MAKLTPMDTQHRIERDWETAAHIQASRDALLAALKALVAVTESIVRDADTSQCDVEWNDVLQFAHAAIAEAERG